MSLQVLLRELGVREAECEPQFTEPNRTVFTEELEKRLVQQERRDWRGTLVSLLCSLVGQDVYEVEKALAEICDLIQLVKRVCKAREQPRALSEWQNRGRGLSGSLEDKCGKVCVKLGFLRGKKSYCKAQLCAQGVFKSQRAIVRRDP